MPKKKKKFSQKKLRCNDMDFLGFYEGFENRWEAELDRFNLWQPSKFGKFTELEKNDFSILIELQKLYKKTESCGFSIRQIDEEMRAIAPHTRGMANAVVSAIKKTILTIDHPKTGELKLRYLTDYDGRSDEMTKAEKSENVSTVDRYLNSNHMWDFAQSCLYLLYSGQSDQSPNRKGGNLKTNIMKNISAPRKKCTIMIQEYSNELSENSVFSEEEVTEIAFQTEKFRRGVTHLLKKNYPVWIEVYGKPQAEFLFTSELKKLCQIRGEDPDHLYSSQIFQEGMIDNGC